MTLTIDPSAAAAVGKINLPSGLLRVDPADPLNLLAVQIRQEAAGVQQAAEKGLGHARTCGELLTQAKAALGHGKWEGWVKENSGIKPRTARLYMQIFEHWNTIKTKGAAVAELTINGAVALLPKRTTARAVARRPTPPAPALAAAVATPEPQPLPNPEPGPEPIRRHSDNQRVVQYPQDRESRLSPENSPRCKTVPSWVYF
jgi:hypothetical protein